MSEKRVVFKTEGEEAEWWAKNQGLIVDRFEEAKVLGKLGMGTVASPTITIRLTEDDLTRARWLAPEKGLRYQTYLKILLRQAPSSGEKTGGRR